MNKITNDTPVWQLSVGEIRDLIKEIVADEQKNDIVVESGDVCYGIDGLAKALGVSRRTAQRYKSSGLLDGAIRQYGKTIIVDKEKLKSTLTK